MLHLRAVGLATVLISLCPLARSQQHIVPTSGDVFGWFGRSVDVAGDVLVVGAPREHGTFEDEGAVHLYRWQNGQWAHDATIFSSEPERNHSFGDEVATDGQRVLITAARNKAAVQSGPRVYVFDITGPVPVEQNILQAPELAVVDDRFGTSVAIDGDRMAVGAPRNDGAGVDAGVVYVFRREGKAWRPEAELRGHDTKIGDHFGIDIALDDTRLVVGARYVDSQTTNAGAAYVFERVGLTWDQAAKLEPQPADAEARFGTAVALHGDEVVIGAPGDDQFGKDTGAAYVFRANGPSWDQVTKLVAHDSSPQDAFGVSVGVTDDHILVGASVQTDYAGSSYVFSDAHGVDWAAQRKLPSPDPQVWYAFGVSGAIDGERIVIGAHGDDTFNTDAGAVWAYEVPEFEAVEVATYCTCHYQGGCGNLAPTTGCLNSTGLGSELTFTGTTSLTGDDFILGAANLPPGELAGLIMGDAGTRVRVGDGQLCVAGVENGLFLFDLQGIAGDGLYGFGPGVLNKAADQFGPAAQVLVGETWSFQVWYTDTGGPCGHKQNFSSAIAVTFGS